VTDLDNLFSAEVRRQLNPLLHSRPYTTFGHISLDRRIPDKKTLIKEIAAWEKNRNKNHTKANWQFTTEKARVKLKNLYPSF
jgi:hypothetical protein